MFQDFHWTHLPALYFGISFCVGAVTSPLQGNAATMAMFGFPPRVTAIPETGVVWQAGQGRIILLGLLMHAFYWTKQYHSCDVMLMGAAFLGFNDYLVAKKLGKYTWAWVRLVASIAFASTGYFGWTAGDVSF